MKGWAGHLACARWSLVCTPIVLWDAPVDAILLSDVEMSFYRF